MKIRKITNNSVNSFEQTRNAEHWMNDEIHWKPFI